MSQETIFVIDTEIFLLKLQSEA